MRGPQDPDPRSPPSYRHLTLIELLLALALLGGAGWFAIHRAREARIAANERDVLAALEGIVQWENVHINRHVRFGTGGEIQMLSPGPDTSGYNLYAVPELPEYSGYRIDLALEGRTRYRVRALPITPGRTGRRCFFVIGEPTKATIRFRVGAAASSADSPIE